jgi:hypothetical protein
MVGLKDALDGAKDGAPGGNVGSVGGALGTFVGDGVGSGAWPTNVPKIRLSPPPWYEYLRVAPIAAMKGRAVLAVMFSKQKPDSA